MPYSKESSAVIHQIAGAKWSQTLHAWHIPYTKEAFRELKSLFPEVVYEKKKPQIQAGQIVTTHMAGSVNQDVTLHITEKMMILKLFDLKP